MTMIREEQPPPGSFDWMLDPANLDIDPPHAPRWRLQDRLPYAELMRRTRGKVAAGLHTPPPTPPERGGGSPRVRVEIEICQRSTRRPRANGGRWFLAALLWAVVAFILMAAVVGKGHAEQWRSHRDGFITRFDSDQGDRGTSYRQGFETLTDINRADGSTQHCRTWKQGWQTFTECN